MRQYNNAFFIWAIVRGTEDMKDECGETMCPNDEWRFHCMCVYVNGPTNVYFLVSAICRRQLSRGSQMEAS